MSNFSYIRDEVNYEEKSAWIMGVLAVLTYAAYLVLVLGRAGPLALPQVPYRTTMLWAIGVSIVASILIHIGVGMFSPRDVDQRDREIARFGDHTGQALLVVGALAALILAMFEVEYFWIANALYLGFVLSAVLGSIAKIAAYRFGFQEA